MWYRGLVLITGCSHPGIVAIATKAKQEMNRNIYLICGGMHLSRSSEDEVKGIINELRKLGVEQVAPCHCTGDKAIAMFKDAFGKAFIPMGVGQLLRIQDVPQAEFGP